MNDKNKFWCKPEIIILTRNKPEEAVLTGCKGDGFPGPEWNDGEAQNCHIFRPERWHLCEDVFDS